MWKGKNANIDLSFRVCIVQMATSSNQQENQELETCCSQKVMKNLNPTSNILRTENSMLPIIENCSEADVPYKEFEMKWKIKCPLKWDDLSTNPDKPKERYCVTCDKSGRVI